MAPPSFTCLTFQGRQCCQDWGERGGHAKARKMPRKQEAFKKVQWRRAREGCSVKATGSWCSLVTNLCIHTPSTLGKHLQSVPGERAPQTRWLLVTPFAAPFSKCRGLWYCMVMLKRGDGASLLMTWHILMLLWCLETCTQVLQREGKCNLDNPVWMWILRVNNCIAKARHS